MTLLEWMKAANLSREQAAARLDLPLGTLDSYLYRARAPSLVEALRLQHLTGDTVRCHEMTRTPKTQKDT